MTPLKFYPPLIENYQLISYYRAGYNGSTLEKGSPAASRRAPSTSSSCSTTSASRRPTSWPSPSAACIGFQFLLSYPERAH